MRHSSRQAAPLLALLAAVLAAVCSLEAQAQSNAPRETPEDTPLTDAPLVIQSIGMSIRLPLGARYETTTMTGGDASFSMVSPAETWRLRLHNPSSRDQSLTPEAVAESLINNLRSTRQVRDRTSRRAAASLVEIFGRQTLEISGQVAERFYAKLPASTGDAIVVSGYTIFQVGPGRFAILEMDTIEKNLESARAEYERVIDSVVLRDPSDVAAERLAGIRLADAMLKDLTREEIDAALPKEPEFVRIYRPATTGASADAEEIAYQRMEMRRGHRGELDPDKARRRWTASDKQEGWVARVSGRSIDGDRFVDSDALYFLSFDRSEEAWSVRMVVRSGEESAGWTETGVRLDDSIKITIDQPRAAPLQRNWRKPPEAYLPQFLLRLLPRLLVQQGSPAVYHFYAYQSATSELNLRRDVLQPADTASDGRAIAWRLISRPDENSLDREALLNQQGEVLRRSLPEGVVMEATSREAIERLWKSKGIPIS